MGHLEEAAEYFEEALRLRRKVIGENHINTAISKFSYADLYLKSGQPEKALTLLEEALQVFKEDLPPDHSFRARTHLRIGLAILETGQVEQAGSIIPDAYRSVQIGRASCRERALVAEVREAW